MKEEIKKTEKPKHLMYCGHNGLRCLVIHPEGICPDVRDCEACKQEKS